MGNFLVFKAAVATQFKRLTNVPLFRTKTEKSVLWDTYLGNFPEGSNPIFRERTTHDCNCCRQFVYAVGNVVGFVDGKLTSIWDIKIPDEPAYQQVADRMHEYVMSKVIDNVFLHWENKAGTDHNFESAMTGLRRWDHFYVTIPTASVVASAIIDNRLGKSRETFEMFTRALTTIKIEDLDTVIELIKQNSLYRGAEFLAMVKKFRQAKEAYDIFAEPKEYYVWQNLTLPSEVTRFRNSVIGTMLVDLAEGKSLEDAVAMFEAKVAPTNYRRSSALITKGMIESAQKKIEELGLTSALSRRYAVLDDITINNILFANRDAANVLNKSVFDTLQAEAKVPSFDKIEEVSIDKFITDILPTAKSVEAFLENRHMSNLVSLVAPQDPTANSLFKWNNNFSWSYNGEVTDAIRERVKAAGGSVSGDVCIRLAWDYTDDLDLSVVEPGNYEIYFSNRRAKSRNGGMLDVDANGLDGVRKDPVENIFYESLNTMKPGSYDVYVNNFSRRSTGKDYTLQIEILGNIHNFTFKGVPGRKHIAATLKVKADRSIEVHSSLEHTSGSIASIGLWGLDTNKFHQVKVAMLSPNHWDDNVSGNKHYFFMLDGCINPEQTRGFYNEFLKGELNDHRKVFEVVAGKMKTPESSEQLSGIGFSSTVPNTLVLKVTGAFSRLLKIKF